MTTIQDAGRDLAPDPGEIRAMLDAIIPDGAPFEIRVLKLRKQTPDGLIEDPYTKAQTGFYEDTVLAASHAARYAGMHCAGVYVTLNQLSPHAQSWGADRIAKGRGAADADILRYRYLYIDVDPVRPSDTNANESERTAARERASQVLAYLRDAGWPDPVWAGNSGSGSMMLFRIDLAPDAQPLIQRALQGLHDLFGDHAVGIDTSVFNPARLVRLAGTVNAKAITPQPERPWALATGKALPNPGTVTREQLEAIAAAEPAPVHREPFTGERYDLPAILAKAGIQHREKQASYGAVYEIADCLTSADHADGACFIQFHSGAVAYRCLHARCSGKGWQDVKALLNLPDRTSGPTLTVVTGGPVEDDATQWDIIPPEKESRTWPEMHDAAYYGLAGDVVKAIDPTTEGDPVAVLEFFLTAFGSACGRNAYIAVGNDQHGANHYVVLVGDSSRSRKGNSRGGVLALMERAAPEWKQQRVLGGLSSGEGLIYAVRDRVERENKKGELEVFDEGVRDKRLLCIEDEFSRVFKVAGRQGSTTSEIMRQAWDGRDTLRVMVKGDTNTASGAHVAIFGNVTEPELLVSLSETDITNGMANRYRWPVVRRSKLIARPRPMPAGVSDALVHRIVAALAFAETAGEMDLAPETEPLWERVYRDELSTPTRGIVGSLTARGDAITLRLALTYALLDRCNEIRPEHLRAALAVWSYSEQSVRYLFGDKTGDWVADRILHILKVEGPKKHIEIVEAFGRNQSAARIQTAIELLNSWGRIVVRSPRKTGTVGRPATVYELIPDKAA